MAHSAAQPPKPPPPPPRPQPPPPMPGIIPAACDPLGPTVASLVAEVTDDKSLPKQERKDRQVAGASHKSPEASVIKLADKTSNLLAIANSPPPWPVDRKRAYVDWAIEVVSGLPLKPAGLLARFEEAARLATESIGQHG